MLILVDSGILLRLMERADPQHGAIRQAIRALVGRGDEPVLSLQNLSEFWNVFTRPAAARGGLGPDIAETDRRWSAFFRSFPSIPPRMSIGDDLSWRTRYKANRSTTPAWRH